MTPENNQTLFEQHQTKLIPLTEEEMATATDESKQAKNKKKHAKEQNKWQKTYKTSKCNWDMRQIPCILLIHLSGTSPIVVQAIISCQRAAKQTAENLQDK